MRRQLLEPVIITFLVTIHLHRAHSRPEMKNRKEDPRRQSHRDRPDKRLASASTSGLLVVRVSASVNKSKVGQPGGNGEDEFTDIYGSGDKHKQAFYQRLNQQRETGHLCDVAVVVEGQRFSAHRCVLAAQSDYFHGLFNHSFIEGQQKEVNIGEITANTMAQVLAFLYSGSCRVNVRTAVDVLMAADMLLLPDLKQRIIDFLIENVSFDDNMLFRYRLGREYSISNLELGARGKIATEFFTFVKTEDFLQLTKDEFAVFLAGNEVVLGGASVTPECREELVFQSVVRWVQAGSLREQHAKELMSNIRFPLMNKTYILDVVKGEPLMAVCSEFIDEAVEYQNTEEGGRGHLQTNRTRPVLKSSEPAICAVRQEGPRAHLACFVVSHNRWYELQTLCLQDGESVTCATAFGSGPALSLMVGTSSGRVYDVQVTQLVELSTTLPGHVACDKLLSVSVKGSKNVYALCSETDPSTGSTFSRMFSLSVKQYVDTASCKELPGIPHTLKQYEVSVMNQKIWVLGESVDPRQDYKTLQCFDVSFSTWSETVIPLTFLPKTPYIACFPVPGSVYNSVLASLCFLVGRQKLQFSERLAKWAKCRSFQLPGDSDTVDDYFMVHANGCHLLSKVPVNGKCQFRCQKTFRAGRGWDLRPSLPWDSCTLLFGT
ncbi:kelch-like protein 29 isoform X1 [Branchiostoma floridae]|uniref:Kelch-like protein 29 isoform X1 n=1 Tax=Branchiostoma floridae TaxID=7739 RepID=A0A9J7MXB5_BRAFL|nr:kelch-like protein 29 isoform X1 [Branchiostoma floridae]